MPWGPAPPTHLASATSWAQKDLGVTNISKHRPAPENRWDPPVDGCPGAHARWWTGAAWGMGQKQAVARGADHSSFQVDKGEVLFQHSPAKGKEG